MKPDTPEDIVQEYISALKYHIDHDLIIKKEAQHYVLEQNS
jgi:hypothetical protein